MTKTEMLMDRWTRSGRMSNKKTFKPGDKFILELGEERKMFDEYEIAGTDLYVKKDLLEKLTPYKTNEQLEIIRCRDCICGHGEVWLLLMVMQIFMDTVARVAFAFCHMIFVVMEKGGKNNERI